MSDFDTDMETIQNYVSSVLEAKNKIVTSYLTAIDNFQLTIQSASPAEAKPDFIKVILKTALKTAEKSAVTAVKAETGADLGPLVELIQGIVDEIERASKASESLSVANWVKGIRTSVSNAFTQGQSGESLRSQLQSEYNQNDEGGRGGYIAGIENELSAMNTVKAPVVQVLELAMYTSWINQCFNGDCVDGTGIVYIQFSDDGALESSSVVAPLGDKIAGGLNSVMAGAGVFRLMDLDVVKKVRRGDFSMCFEGNNVVRMSTDNDDAQKFLNSQDTWNQATQF